MEELIAFIDKHSVRGTCTCGKCVDAPPDPEQPPGHTADLIFFRVAMVGTPDAEELRRLIVANPTGDFAAVNPFDGKEHGYIELGGWIGDQGCALRLMGLGALLGIWKLLTPKTVLPAGLLDDAAVTRLAEMGFVTIQVTESTKG